MENMERLLQVLADLVKINLNQAACYQHIKEMYPAHSNELTFILTSKLEQSERNAALLTQLIQSFGQLYAPMQMKPGALLQDWLEQSAKVSSAEMTSILQGCECSESAVLEAYQMALSGDCVTDITSRVLLMDQKYALQSFRFSFSRFNDFNAILPVA